MTLDENWQKLAHHLIPGGAHTYSRGDDQYPLNAPSVLSHGQGAYVWDPNGNKYLDYGMALRAITIGYNYAKISDAAIREIHKGNNLTRASVTEIEAARDLTELIPWAEMVKFAKNGSTVTSAAIKLARAYTGRNLVARCAQHPFFSYDDWFIGDTLMYSGVPQEISKLTVQFQFNNIASLENLFKQYPGQISSVILEPATTEEPSKNSDGSNYLHDVQRLCKRYGAVFILDEMITGFRWHIQGASRVYDVVPDLVTFGKGMANGFSVAALAGKREIMELGGLEHDRERIFLISTTHGAEMCGLGAFSETVRIYKELGVIEHLWNYGKNLTSAFNDSAKKHGINSCFKMVGVPCSPNYLTADLAGVPSLPLRTLFSQEMVTQGILMPWVAICFQHGDKELELTAKAFDSALSVCARALEDGVEKFLRGRPIRPVFRKYN